MNEIVVKQIIKIFRISDTAVVSKHLVLILLKPYKITGCFQGICQFMMLLVTIFLSKDNNAHKWIDHFIAFNEFSPYNRLLIPSQLRYAKEIF